MRIEEITAPELLQDVPETFEQFTKQGAQAGYFTLMARNEQRIPIRYEARVFPDGCLVARWTLFENSTVHRAHSMKVSFLNHPQVFL